MYHRNMEREVFECSGKTGGGDERDEDIRYAYLGARRGKMEGKWKMWSEETMALHSGWESHTRGVGILMSQETASALMSWEPINDRTINCKTQRKILQ